MLRFTRFLAVTALAATTVSCGSTVGIGGGRGPSFLVIDSLQGIRGGAGSATASSPLTSDVETLVTTPEPCSATSPCPFVFGDLGQVVMHVVMKDAGSPTPTQPTPLNDITLTRYRVVYTRADGRNIPGVDVPHPFDGALTITVTASATTIPFTLVRVQAKDETPLVLLKNPRAGIITGFAEVTFYGLDQDRNEVSITGSIQINFGNFGDS